jgi:hypothetical protein
MKQYVVCEDMLRLFYDAKEKSLPSFEFLVKNLEHIEALRKEIEIGYIIGLDMSAELND